jgi:hypothetical protein
MNPVTWHEIALRLSSRMCGPVLRIESVRVQHPRDGGLVPMMSLPFGQNAAWGARLPSGATLSVLDFGDYYDVTLHEPAARPPVVTGPSPAATVAGFAALGALFGLALGQSKESALAGAAIGGAAALAGVAVDQASASPATSLAALEALKVVGTALQAAKSAQPLPPASTSSHSLLAPRSAAASRRRARP